MTDNKQKIIKALENEKYDWRTINGLISETGLKEDEIRSELNAMNGTLVCSKSGNGEVYTTRKHYEKRLTGTRKLISALTGVAV